MERLSRWASRPSCRHQVHETKRKPVKLLRFEFVDVELWRSSVLANNGGCRRQPCIACSLNLESDGDVSAGCARAATMVVQTLPAALDHGPQPVRALDGAALTFSEAAPSVKEPNDGNDAAHVINPKAVPFTCQENKWPSQSQICGGGAKGTRTPDLLVAKA
jgi:hypothetical protein